jgi:hypothetical protein
MNAVFWPGVRTCYEDSVDVDIACYADRPHFIERRRTVFAWPSSHRQSGPGKLTQAR